MISVAIVGGGISGLSAAYFLENLASDAGLDISIQLIESSSRLGGVILTEHAAGFLLEGGPDSFLTIKPAAVELCRRLNLQNELIPSNDPQRKTYILWQNRLRKLPADLTFVAPNRVLPFFQSDLFSLAGKARLALAGLTRGAPLNGKDVSVGEYIRKRLGSEMLERIAEPLLAAVYGAQADSLSARAVIPQLISLEEKYGSLWRGVREARRERTRASQGRPATGLFVTLRSGLGLIPEGLERALTRTAVVREREVRNVARIGNRAGFRLQWVGGEIETSAVILATPAWSAANMLRDLDPRLSANLREIAYHSSLLVSLGFERKSVGRPLDGFGFLVPREEGKRVIACTWASTKFANRSQPDQVLMRAFLGGERDPAILEEDDGAILEIVHRELAEIMDIRGVPILQRIHRWRNCLPAYRVGHLQLLQSISVCLQNHPGLFLAGNAYGGIGIPDCIQSGSAAAHAAMRRLQSQH